MLVSLFITSTLVIALASGLLVLVRTTGATSERQLAQTAVMNAAEWLKLDTYTDCGGVADYEAQLAGLQLPSGVVVRVAEVRYWAGVDGDPPFDSTCGVDLGAQYLRLEATVGETTVEGDLVVRDP